MPNWNQVLKEISDIHQKHGQQSKSSVDIVRHKYLLKLHNKTKRNIIAYYSGFLSKPQIDQTVIMDEDKNGFMMAIHNLDRSKGLDLIIHTPGGDIPATESLVYYLRKMFGNDIRAIIPQMAMSAGTMLACSCNSIMMGKHSNLGPIDPQISGIPAHGVIKEFNQACEEANLSPGKQAMWAQIISKYNPTFLSQCSNAIDWSKQFVTEQLKTVMFAGEGDAEKRATAIVNKLSSYDDNKTHARHIHIDECKELGLKIEDIETDNQLQDLILTVHHCYMHSLMNTPTFKIIENHKGVAFAKQQIIQMLQQ